MKRKFDSLEKMLRKPEAKLPADLRMRTLRRTGLRRPTTTWFRQPLTIAASLASALALALILSPRPSTEKKSATRDAAATLAANKPTPKVTPLPQCQNSEQIGAPASAAAGMNSSQGNDLSNARTDTAPKTNKPSYRLSVRGNRIRPELNERIKLALQITQYGRVRVRVCDSQGRMLRELADLNNPVGPILLEWDGRLADGQGVPSGAYSLLIQSPDKTQKVRVLVIR